MKELSKPALDAVLNGDIHLHPAKFKNLYRHWMENVRDWCISRQLWWGHRIPAWYYDNNEFVVAENITEALEAGKREKRQSMILRKPISGRMKMFLIHGSHHGSGQ